MRFIGRKTLSSSRARQRKIDQTFEAAAYVMLLVYYCYVMVAWVSHREFIAITAITTNGTHAVSPELLVSSATKELAGNIFWKIARNNTLMYPKYRIMSAVRELDPRIASVVVSAGDNRLTVGISEYEPKYLWCPPTAEPQTDEGAASSTPTFSISDCYYADNMGYIYARAPGYSGSVYLAWFVELPDNNRPIGAYILPKVELNDALDFVAGLEEMGIHTTSVQTLSEGDYRATLDRSWALSWSGKNPTATSLKNLRIVLDEITSQGRSLDDVSEIDLRFGSKIFYR